jgi:hypothetical protein
LVRKEEMVGNLSGAERTQKIPFAPAVYPPGKAVSGGCDVLTTPLPVLSMEEAESLLLAQVRYDECVAMRNLQTLFENGELEALGW